MRRKALLAFLCLEAVACIFLGIWGGDSLISYRTVAAIPFEQIGQGLRFLSESGAFGNVIAVTLYIVICFTPILYGFLTGTRRVPSPEDALLVLLSLLLFGFLYLFVNPTSIQSMLPAMFGSGFGKALMGQMIYSVLLAYLILRFLQHVNKADRQILQKYLTILLCAVAALFVFAAFGTGFGQFVDSVREPSAFDAMIVDGMSSSAAIPVDRMLTIILLFVGFLVRSVSYLGSVMIIFSVLRLLKNMEKGRYSEDTVLAAQNLSRHCGTLLTVTVISGLTYNLLQFLLIKNLQTSNINVDIPVFSLVFILTILLATQLVRDNRKLQEDNSLFI